MIAPTPQAKPKPQPVDSRAKLVNRTPAQTLKTITQRVADSGDFILIGGCCINLDKCGTDAQINAIFAAVEEIRASGTGLHETV